MTKIYVAYTGGTIGMRRTPHGYAPAPGLLEEQVRAMPEMADAAMPALQIHEYEPLLDSSNMRPADWLAIAGDIVEHYDDYDGFVVLHGTDTMAYTASALPFLLCNLGKPVILTGSQLPLGDIRSDGRANLITALLLVAHHPIPEVCLCFGRKLLRGCRATKVDAEGFEAFDSPNYPPLGHLGVNLLIDADHVRTPGDVRITSLAADFGQTTVGAFRLFPGVSAELLRRVLEPPLQGLVLEAYGAGGGPTMDATFLAVLQEATARGLVIVATTQCLRGAVHLGAYATTSALARAGVISGHDMTAEAALCKLYCLLSGGHPPETIKRLMGENLRGELTVAGG